MMPFQAMRLRAAVSGGGGITYATWNPSDKSASVGLPGGSNLIAVRPGGGTTYEGVRATIAVSSKSYWEVAMTWGGSGGRACIGLATSGLTLSSATVFPGNTSTSTSIVGPNNTVYINSTSTDYGNALGADTVGIAFNPATGNGWIRSLDVGTGFLGGGDPASGTSPTFTLPAGTYYPIISIISGVSEQFTANFGQSAFTGSVPSGFNSGVY